MNNRVIRNEITIPDGFHFSTDDGISINTSKCTKEYPYYIFDGFVENKCKINKNLYPINIEEGTDINENTKTNLEDNKKITCKPGFNNSKLQSEDRNDSYPYISCDYENPIADFNDNTFATKSNLILECASLTPKRVPNLKISNFSSFIISASKKLDNNKKIIFFI